MYLRFIMQCWFALLVMVLPSQVFASSLDSEASNQHHASKVHVDAELVTFSFKHDWLFSLASQPSIPQPQSQSHFSHSTYAILNHSRNASNPRVMLSGGSDLPFDLDSDAVRPSDCTYWPQFITVSYSNRNYDFFTSSHRLAGWKESNAMYVALNSQF